MKSAPKPPVIVLGMHRSGTSMVSRLLEEMGVFMGADLEENNESRFFIHINDWLLTQAGVSVQDPKSFSYVSEGFIGLMAEVIINRFKTLHRKKYLGKGHSYQSLDLIDIPWGWKDPRNTITYEVWRTIFPGSRILHIYRNPVDVSRSLVHRERESINKFSGTIKTRTGIRKKLMGYCLPRKRLFFQYFRSTNMQGAYDMWTEYLQAAMNIKPDPQGGILHICYEEFLAGKRETLITIADFLDLDIDDNTLDTIASGIKTERRFAFLGDKESEDFYQKIKNDPMVRKLNYHNLI